MIISNFYERNDPSQDRIHSFTDDLVNCEDNSFYIGVDLNNHEEGWNLDESRFQSQHQTADNSSFPITNQRINSLGLWTMDRAEALTQKSTACGVGSSLKAQRQSRVNSVDDFSKFSMNESTDETSLEALLLRSRSMPNLQILVTEKNELDIYDNSTECTANSFETLGSLDTSPRSTSNESFDNISSAKPVKIDVRKKYLSSVGIKKFSYSKPAKDSFASKYAMGRERLKDHSNQDMTFEDFIKVMGSLIGLPISQNNPTSKRPCRKCLKSKLSSCHHKRVRFCGTVSVAYIPVHHDYSNRVRAGYWNSAAEIRAMVFRNMLEFSVEGYDWENVAEEKDMYYNEYNHEFIHPAFYDMLMSDSNLAQNNGMVNEPRQLPRQEKNEGLWA